jgi:hypothetical protein
MFPQLYQDLLKQMRQFIEKFLEAFRRNELAEGNRQFELVQDFYKKIYKYILTNASVRTCLEKSAPLLGAIESSKQQQQHQNSSTILNGTTNGGDYAQRLYEAIMILVESYVTTNIYDYVFPFMMTEFEEQDMYLQKKIRSFYWVTNEMIGTCLDENSIFYRDAYEEAINCKKKTKIS